MPDGALRRGGQTGKALCPRRCHTESVARPDARGDDHRPYSTLKSVYVEAGLLHLSLLNQLTRRLPAEYRIRPVYLMAPIVRQLSSRRQSPCSGDKLTLLYTYRPDYALPRADRLAAQSLIYTKIIIKEEMIGPANTFPHTRNEVESSGLVQKLTYSDCEKLYALIKNRTTKEAMETVQVYIKK